MTPAEMLLAGEPSLDRIMAAYYEHYYPLCHGCNERIPPSKQLPPSERIRYDSDKTGKHLSVCPKSLEETP